MFLIPWTGIIFIISSLLQVLPAFAVDHWQQGEKNLLELRKNPRAYIESLPEKWASDGTIADSHTMFSAKDVVNKEYVRKKAFFRNEVIGGDFVGFSVPKAHDQYTDLVDNPKTAIRNIHDMDQVRKASLPVRPWSGDYWAIEKGNIASRPFDEEFSLLIEWKERFDFVSQNPFLDIFNSGRADEINRLSAAEKYDLLIGDEAGQLTQHMWGEGKHYYDLTGEVESWMGICHGWAVASYLLERPQHSIQVTAFDNKTQIKLYPAEIKALASYLWAKGTFTARFVGGRCNEKDPTKDVNGRVIDEKCRDNNPATWHTAVVNQIGINKRSFVMDATYDFEVWNQPVYSYEYNYFNPQTKTQSENLTDSVVDLKDYKDDLFTIHRGAQTKKIVGVVMSVTYVVETPPLPVDFEGPDFDQTVTVQYLYDLELDDNGEILGGEWYTNYHPDFLWTVPQGTKPQRSFKDVLGSDNWDGKSLVPKSWRDLGAMASYYGLVLQPIIEKLVHHSK